MYCTFLFFASCQDGCEYPSTSFILDFIARWCVSSGGKVLFFMCSLIILEPHCLDASTLLDLAHMLTCHVARLVPAVLFDMAWLSVPSCLRAMPLCVSVFFCL